MGQRRIAAWSWGVLALAFAVFNADGAPQVKEPLYRDQWRLNCGPGAAGKLEIKGGKLLVDADFRKGGSYVAAERNLPVPANLDRLNFTVKGVSGRIAVNFFDSRGQVHQHFLDAGKGKEGVSRLSLAVGPSSHHWGGPNDGKLVQPIRRYSFVIHKPDLKSARNTVEFSDISVETSDPRVQMVEWSVPNPETLFRKTGERTPVEINIFPEVKGRGPEALRFLYRDYAGVERLAGTAQFDEKRGVLIAPPPPGNGFYELSYPGLNIQLGVVTDEPAPAKADEFFGIDGSFSWGGPPSDEKGIRSYLRILKKNGIVWNRDRFSWGTLEPRPGKFNFKNRFGLYHGIAGEEGIRTLDTFHKAPKWTGAGEPCWDYGTRSNPYPDDFFVTGRSLTRIAREWKNTLRAMEIWNEPDYGFGSYFPPEYVTALTKAVSRAFATAGVNTKVVGGVISVTRPGTGYYDAFVRNGLLKDCNVMSFHSYTDTLMLEAEVKALREVELKWEPSRSGIPIWITECGMPWFCSGNFRPALPDDLNSAVEIVAKAVEMRALGLEHYFAFGYAYYSEGLRNFGTMDAKHTPLRSLAAYFHLVRVLSHREYAGDLKGTNALRSRVFRSGNDLVAVLYTGMQTKAKEKFSGVKAERRDYFTIPAGLPVIRAAGADGRTLTVKDNRLSSGDGLVYLYLPLQAEKDFVDRNTEAMRLYKIAKNFNAAPRAAKPLVFQPVSDLKQFHVDRYGFLLDRPSAEVKVRINNFGDKTLKFEPELKLDEGISVQKPPQSVDVPARGTAEVSFQLVFDANVKPAQFRAVSLRDRNGNATDICFSFQPYETKPIPILPVAAMERDRTLSALLAGRNWFDISSAPYWRPWVPSVMVANIGAKFRMFWSSRELICQILVKDPEHFNNHPADSVWWGDSVQMSVQMRGADRKATGSWNEVQAARSGGKEILWRTRAYKHMPQGLCKASRLDFTRFEEGYSLYEIHFDAEEMGLKLTPGAIIGASLLVNSDSGVGRDGYLSYGQGIGDGKGDALFRLFQLVSQPESGAKSGK